MRFPFVLLMLIGLPLQAADKPNVLFIFADDQSFETIHALGHERIETPNLDSLVERGTTFTHAYNMGSWSGAVCVASRCMLNTGRFIWNANAVFAKTEQERVEGRFWSEYMKVAGYKTYMTGKWHVRADATKAFDVAAHVRGGMPNQVKEGYYRPKSKDDKTWLPWDPQWGGFWKGGKHWSEVVADDAIGFLDDAAKQDNPFFMYIAFNAPHDPRQSPKEYVDKYPIDTIAVPDNFLPLYPHKDSIALGTKQRDESLAPFPRTEYAVKVNRQEYYAIITHMDAQIGRILKALEESDQLDNTYIVFSADHGLAVGHHGLMGKQNMYDHSLRVPFMVVGPGVDAGKKLDAPIFLQDVMPTTLEWAGVEKPEHVEFNSLTPFLAGDRTESYYDAIYGAYLGVQRSITYEGYKLIVYPTIKVARLFNLGKDPSEKEDLIANKKTTRIQKKLFAKLLEWQKTTHDKLDVASAFPDLMP